MILHLNSFWSRLAATIITIICITVFYIKRKYNFWTGQGIAQIHATFPFGSSKNIFRTESIGEYLERMHLYFKSKGEPFGGYYVGLRPELLLIDPDMIRTILVQDYFYFNNQCLHNDPKHDSLINNLMGMSGNVWQKMRKKLIPIFTISKIKSILFILQDVSKSLDKVLAEAAKIRKPVDISQIILNYTTDDIGSWIYGLQVNSLQNKMSQFKKYVDMFFVTKGINLFLYAFSYLYSEILRALKISIWSKDLTKYFMNVAQDTVEYREKNHLARNDFIHYLIQMKTVDNENAEYGITLQEIAAQCYLFLSAGYETSAEAQIFCLYELAKHQDIQEKLRYEILEVLDVHKDISYDAIMEMHYLDKVVYETLRKYPPLPFLIRKCIQDYTIPNTKIVIRKGQVVTISLLGIHKDPTIFPDPYKFDPNRFNEEEKNKRCPCAYIPYGAGPRHCLGAKLGLFKMKMGIITVIKNYKLTLSSKMQEPLEIAPEHLTLYPKNRIWMNVVKIPSTEDTTCNMQKDVEVRTH